MFECVQICTVSDTLHALQCSAAVPIAPRGLSGIECRPVQRVQRPGGGMPWYLSALVLGRPALLPVMCRPSGCAGAWVSTGGVYSRRPAPPGQSFNHRKNKKGSKKNHHTPIVNLKNFPQKQKDPYKGSGFCVILALQALKGRNLQWLKVK